MSSEQFGQTVSKIKRNIPHNQAGRSLPGLPRF